MFVQFAMSGSQAGLVRAGGKKPTELSEAQKMISHTVQREDGIWMTEFRQAGDAVPENTSLPRSLLGGERVLHRFLLPG